MAPFVSAFGLSLESPSPLGIPNSQSISCSTELGYSMLAFQRRQNLPFSLRLCRFALLYGFRPLTDLHFQLFLAWNIMLVALTIQQGNTYLLPNHVQQACSAKCYGSGWREGGRNLGLHSLFWHSFQERERALHFPNLLLPPSFFTSWLASLVWAAHLVYFYQIDILIIK